MCCFVKAVHKWSPFGTRVPNEALCVVAQLDRAKLVKKDWLGQGPNLDGFGYSIKWYTISMLMYVCYISYIPYVYIYILSWCILIPSPVFSGSNGPGTVEDEESHNAYVSSPLRCCGQRQVYVGVHGYQVTRGTSGFVSKLGTHRVFLIVWWPWINVNIVNAPFSRHTHMPCHQVSEGLRHVSFCQSPQP